MASKYCVANWKMNFNREQGRKFIYNLNSKDLNNGKSQIILCPPFTSLFSIVDACAESVVTVGAQNFSFRASWRTGPGAKLQHRPPPVTQSVAVSPGAIAIRDITMI